MCRPQTRMVDLVVGRYAARSLFKSASHQIMKKPNWRWRRSIPTLLHCSLRPPFLSYHRAHLTSLIYCSCSADECSVTDTEGQTDATVD